MPGIPNPFAPAIGALDMASKAQKMMETKKQRAALLDRVNRMENTLGGIYSRSSGAQSDVPFIPYLSGKMKEIGAKFGVGEEAPEIASYTTLSNLIFSTFARQIGQEKGNLSEGDVQRVKAAIPTVASTPEQAAAQFKELRRMILQMPSSFFENPVPGLQGGAE